MPFLIEQQRIGTAGRNATLAVSVSVSIAVVAAWTVTALAVGCAATAAVSCLHDKAHLREEFVVPVVPFFLLLSFFRVEGVVFVPLIYILRQKSNLVVYRTLCRCPGGKIRVSYGGISAVRSVKQGSLLLKLVKLQCRVPGYPHRRWSVLQCTLLKSNILRIRYRNLIINGLEMPLDRCHIPNRGTSFEP